MSKWADINARIQECRGGRDPVTCLRLLFRETNDGMVALALGEELEKQSCSDEALAYFEKAEQLFPLSQFKERARKAQARIRTTMANDRRPGYGSPESLRGSSLPETLVVVSCTRKKIWEESTDAPTYVPASEAYIGEKMKSWLASESCRKASHWIILSAKYGFIEPDHPVSNYDVTFDRDETGTISLDSLRAQVEHQVRWQDKHPLRDFATIRVWGSNTYLAVVRAAFMRTNADVGKCSQMTERAET